MPMAEHSVDNEHSDRCRTIQNPPLKVNMSQETPRQIRNAYDCLSICSIKWTSNTFKIISSPNMSWIPEFPDFDEERGVYQRADGHWGPHEYSIWPQIYCHTLVHHMCIPHEIEDPPMHEILRKGGIVWRAVEAKDWKESGPSPYEVFLEPIGKLDQDFSNELSRALELTIAIVVDAEDDLDNDQRMLLLHITNQARLAVEQLKREPRAECDVVQRVREVQRSIRELFGLYFYVIHVVRRNRDDATQTDTHPYGFRGVFVDDGILAEEIRRARVPVWFIRPYESVLNDTRIYKIVEPTPWDLVLDRYPWSSRSSGKELFMAITSSSRRVASLRSGRNSLLVDVKMAALIDDMRHAMGRDQGLNREPLMIGNSLTKRSLDQVDSPVSPPNMYSSDNEQPRKKKQRGKRRNKPSSSGDHLQSGKTDILPLSFSISFGIPSNLPDLPAIPSPWQIALRRVSPLPVYRESPARYHFPPAHLFGAQDPEKAYEHIHNWIRIKPFCERAALGQSVYLIEKGGLKIQDWRIALLGDYTKGFLPLDKAVAMPSLERLRDSIPSRNDLVPKIDPGAMGKSRSKIARNAHQQSIKVIFAVEGNFTPYLRSCVASWAGRSVSFDDIRSDAALRARILWDVCECQFRMDIINADQVLTGMDVIGDSMAAGLRAYSAQRIWRDVDGSPRLFPNTDGTIQDLWAGSCNKHMLNGFLEVLRSWPDSPEWMLTFDSETQSEDANRRALQDCIDFYVNKFVDIFHRLPLPPAHVP